MTCYFKTFQEIWTNWAGIQGGAGYGSALYSHQLQTVTSERELDPHHCLDQNISSLNTSSTIPGVRIGNLDRHHASSPAHHAKPVTMISCAHGNQEVWIRWVNQHELNMCQSKMGEHFADLNVDPFPIQRDWSNVFIFWVFDLPSLHQDTVLESVHRKKDPKCVTPPTQHVFPLCLDKGWCLSNLVLGRGYFVTISLNKSDKHKCKYTHAYT